MTPRLILLAGLILLGGTSGCRRMARVSECRELIAAVNGHMDTLEPLSKSKDSPEKYTKLGQTYQKRADDAMKSFEFLMKNFAAVMEEFVIGFRGGKAPSIK